MDLINTENELIHTTIKERCKKNGISVTKLCEIAKVNYNSVANWKKKNSSTVDALTAIEKAFKKIENK